jgi:hypothetical protein
LEWGAAEAVDDSIVSPDVELNIRSASFNHTGFTFSHTVRNHTADHSGKYITWSPGFEYDLYYTALVDVKDDIMEITRWHPDLEIMEWAGGSEQSETMLSASSNIQNSKVKLPEVGVEMNAVVLLPA